MPSTNVRISERSYLVLKRIADQEAKPMPMLLDEAVESLRRKRFLTEVNQAFAALKADPKAWRAELEERALWDNTLADGEKTR